MRQSALFLLAAIACAGVCSDMLAAEQQSAGVVLYVATAGNDAWSGRLPEPNAAGTDGPLATIAAARDRVRELKAQGPVTVQVRGGTYYLAEPIVFTPEDSGTESHPITYEAYPGERPVLSGGRPVTGWTTTDGTLYRATVPDSADPKHGFRQLRVGTRRQIRARYPNFDPNKPITGGWLFARTPLKDPPLFGTTMGSIHNKGDYMEYDLQVPSDGLYHYWAYVGIFNAPYDPKDVTGHTVISADGGEPVPLMNMHDTGGWDRFQWRHAADIELQEGTRRLRWENVEGGGINFDLFVLTDDPEWKPTGPSVPKARAGRHLLLVEAEDHVKAQGPQMSKSAAPFKSDREIHVDAGALKDWPSAPDAEVHIFPYRGWFSGILPVAEVDTERSCVIAGMDCPGQVWEGNRSFLENLPEELDAPGEWYLDRKTGEITYLRDQLAPDRSETALSDLDRIVEFRGDEKGEETVRHITLRGFTITDTDYSPTQKSLYFPDGAAVWMIGASHCRVQECLFRDIGGWALAIRWAATDNVFEGNTVVGAGMGGVYVSGAPLESPHASGPAESRPLRNVISGNYIHHCGKVFAHVAGVYITHADQNVARHNLIHHMPRYGLSIKSNSADNVFEYNHVYHTNLETNDTGGIEMWMNHKGGTVRYNIVGDTIGLKTMSDGEIVTPCFTWGIYLDGTSSGVTVEGNIVYRNMVGGIIINGGSDTTIVGNIFVEGRHRQAQFNNYERTGRGNTFRRNIIYYKGAESRTFNYSRVTPEFLDSDYNLLWHGGEPLAVTMFTDGVGRKEGPWPVWVEGGLDEHSLVADPLFVNPDADDYRLKPDSPAFKLGFEPIPVEKIGLAGAPLRPPAWHGEEYAP